MQTNLLKGMFAYRKYDLCTKELIRSFHCVDNEPQILGDFTVQQQICSLLLFFSSFAWTCGHPHCSCHCRCNRWALPNILLLLLSLSSEVVVGVTIESDGRASLVSNQTNKIITQLNTWPALRASNAWRQPMTDRTDFERWRRKMETTIIREAARMEPPQRRRCINRT